MILILRDLLVFCFVLSGCTLLGMGMLRRPAPWEHFVLGLGLGLVLDYLVLGALYLTGAPLVWHAGLAAAGWLLPGGRAVLSSYVRDPSFRAQGVRWLIFAGWLLGWQMLVYSYIGGAWAGDWKEHYDRAHFFLARWPHDHLFLGLYPLPARPPLANLLTAGLLALSGGAFAHYQVFCTLLSSLVYFPLTLLVQRWDGRLQAQSTLLVLLMLSPLVVQNATYPWTKLPAAFFVLIAISQLAPSSDGLGRERFSAGCLALTAGMLAHYSAGPWILGLLPAWLAQNRAAWRHPLFRRTMLWAGAGSTLLFCTWLAWSLQVYGPTTTFTHNSTVAFGAKGGWTERIHLIAVNLWHTLIPSFSSGRDHPMLQQASLLGQWCDSWFNLYQLNLPFAFGLLGGVILVWQLRRPTPAKPALFWWIALPVSLVLGTAAQGGLDTLGLTHITLQPLVLLGLARLAAQTDRLPRWLSCCWAAGLALDFAFGIVLHFCVQSLWLDRWLQPGSSALQIIQNYSDPALRNYLGKERLHLAYLADTVPAALPVLLLILSGLLAAWIATRPSAAAAGAGGPTAV